MAAPDVLKHTPQASETEATFGSGVGASLLPPIDAGTSSRGKPTIAIMSLGEMGMGIALLLSRYSYPVVTNLDRRSARTKARAETIGIQSLPFAEMLKMASLFLSILPPKEAYPQAASTAAALRQIGARSPHKLVYMDLNATSPDLSRQISGVLIGAGVTYIDGAILGFPPREVSENNWFRPAITTSGPHLAALNEPWTADLASLLNLRHVGDEVGAASGLKMCFGAIYKGQAAIATQAYTTARSLGVLPALRTHMAEYFPASVNVIENSVIGSQRKAYRWIKEMEEVEDTFAKEGGWGRELFRGVASFSRVVADETRLGSDMKTDVEAVTGEICRGLERSKSVR